MLSFLTSSYQTLDLYNPFVSLELIVWSVFIGIIIGALASLYNKRIIGSFVRTLLSANAKSPEEALSVHELGFDKNKFVLIALRNGSTLRKLVYCTENAAKSGKYNIGDKIQKFFTGEYPPRKVDFSNAKFYIPEELSARAEIRYEKKGTDLFSFMMTILVFLAVVFISLKVVPQILGMLDDVIAGFKGNDNTLCIFSDIIRRL